MPMRLPVSLEVEYRGVKPQREYTLRETGELRTASAVLKFEAELPDGDIALIEVAATTLDRLRPAVDYVTFARGQRFTMSGTAVIQDRGSEYDSYFAVTSCEAVSKGVRAKAV